MAYETKVIFSLVLSIIARAESVGEAYETIRAALGNVEDMTLPSYEEFQAKFGDKN